MSKDKAYEKRYKFILNLIKELKIEDKVIVHDPVSYKELPAYVKAAECVVVPSLAEGFGFAAAEACAMDVPVVASDTTSLPEVVSGRYVLVRPKNPLSIVEGVFSFFKKDFKITQKKHFYNNVNIRNYIPVYGALLKND